MAFSRHTDRDGPKSKSPSFLRSRVRRLRKATHKGHKARRGSSSVVMGSSWLWVWIPTKETEMEMLNSAGGEKEPSSRFVTTAAKRLISVTKVDPTETPNNVRSGERDQIRIVSEVKKGGEASNERECRSRCCIIDALKLNMLMTCYIALYCICIF